MCPATAPCPGLKVDLLSVSGALGELCQRPSSGRGATGFLFRPGTAQLDLVQLSPLKRSFTAVTETPLTLNKMNTDLGKVLLTHVGGIRACTGGRGFVLPFCLWSWGVGAAGFVLSAPSGREAPPPPQVAGVRPLRLLAFAATAGRGTGASGWNFRPLPCCPQGGSLGPAVLIRTATSTC